MNKRDERYLEILQNRLDICKNYLPKFGTGNSVSIEEFKRMHSEDPLYSWFGLDNPLIYAAHKAAGGITSVYRQIGMGCEELFQTILQDELDLDKEQVNWTYEIESDSGSTRELSLDARIAFSEISNTEKRKLVNDWANQFALDLKVSPKITKALDGVVFEVRQGYKSKDSKRQNADIYNITSAYASGYLPVFTVLSTQIDLDVASRYRSNKCPVLVGSLNESPFISTYSFFEKVISYDLAGFFERNSKVLKKKIDEIVETLLSPSS